MPKPTSRLSRRTVTISILASLMSIVVVIVLATTIKRRRDRSKSLIVPQPPTQGETDTTNVVQGDLFAGDDQEGNQDPVVARQEDCKWTGDVCTRFSDECCTPMICAPVNQTTSVCSDYRGTICTANGMICSDAVAGVNCCDDYVCSAAPEPGHPNRQRCFPPSTAESTSTWTYSVESTTPSPTPRSSLRR